MLFMGVRWEDYSWVELGSKIGDVKAVLLPVGSIEQHGPHLPLKTDSLSAYTIALDVAKEFSGEILVLPPIYYGVSEHHMDFVGTITISSDVLIDLVCNIARSVMRHGIKKLVIINGHGGNISALEIAVRRIADEGMDVILINPWELITDVIEKTLESKIWGHACEFETSVILAIDESVVRKEKIPKNEIKSAGKYLDLWGKTHVRWAWRTKYFSDYGVLGFPEKASKDKGRILYQEMVKRTREAVEEFIKK